MASAATGNVVIWKVLQNNFPAIKASMALNAERIVAKAAMDIQAQAQVRAPVRTGMLKSSIQASRVGKAHWQVVVGADYGVYVEYGTVRLGARPFLSPAANLVRPQFFAAMKGVI